MHLQNRTHHRSRVLLTGRVRFDDCEKDVVIRNLSVHGALVESPNESMPEVGSVGIFVRNGKEVGFGVAWAQDNRYGIRFINEIEAKELLTPIGKAKISSAKTAPRFWRPGIRRSPLS